MGKISGLGNTGHGTRKNLVSDNMVLYVLSVQPPYAGVEGKELYCCVLGFMAVIFTYLGVNLFFQDSSYGSE
jgi:hypothetical protein